jgi:hypothetical protein
LHADGVECTLSVGREVKMEIPDQTSLSVLHPCTVWYHAMRTGIDENLSHERKIAGAHYPPLAAVDEDKDRRLLPLGHVRTGADGSLGQLANL